MRKIKEIVVNIFAGGLLAKFILFLICFSIILITFVSFKFGYIDFEEIIIFFKSSHIYSPISFVLIYMILAMSFVPTLPLNLIAGFLWGTFYGTLLTVTGATLGALISFIISRYLFKDTVTELLKNKKWDFFKDNLLKKDWKLVAFTRLNPIFPFGPTSWFFGISKISIFSFIIPTVVCIIPAATAFSAIGMSIESFMLTGDQKVYYQNILLASFLLTALFVVKILIKKKFKE